MKTPLTSGASAKYFQSAGNIIITWLLLFALTSVVAAQSKDKNNPTPLTSPEVSGSADPKTPGNYYYSFTAGPGEVVVTVTFNVEPANVRKLGFMLGCCLQGEDGKSIPFYVSSPERSVPCLGFTGKDKESVVRVMVPRRQTVVLSLDTGGDGGSSGGYRVQLSGAVEFSKSDKPITSDKDKPTPLTSPEILGVADPKTTTEAYYSFIAGPGKVEITLELQNTKPISGLGSAGLDLSGEDPLFIILRAPTEPRGIVTFPKRKQRVVLHLLIDPNTVGSGQYRIRISGAAVFGEASGRQ